MIMVNATATNGAVLNFRSWFGDEAPLIVVTSLLDGKYLVLVLWSRDPLKYWLTDMVYLEAANSIAEGIIGAARYVLECLEVDIPRAEWLLNNPKCDGSERNPLSEDEVTEVRRWLQR